MERNFPSTDQEELSFFHFYGITFLLKEFEFQSCRLKYKSVFMCVFQRLLTTFGFGIWTEVMNKNLKET